MKEDTLNYVGIPNMIYGMFLNYAILVPTSVVTTSGYPIRRILGHAACSFGGLSCFRASDVSKTTWALSGPQHKDSANRGCWNILVFGLRTRMYFEGQGR